MNILKLTQKAREYYDACKSKSLYSGYEKNILVRPDSEEAVFVDANYTPRPGDFIFRAKSMNTNTVIDLKTQVPSLEEQALKGKFTREEWMEILNRLTLFLAKQRWQNGILYVPEIPAREHIAGEMTDPAIEEKIMKLTDYEAKMLLSAIQIFWKINDMSYIEDFLK